MTYLVRHGLHLDPDRASAAVGAGRKAGRRRRPEAAVPGVAACRSAPPTTRRPLSVGWFRGSGLAAFAPQPPRGAVVSRQDFVLPQPPVAAGRPGSGVDPKRAVPGVAAFGLSPPTTRRPLSVGWFRGSGLAAFAPQPPKGAGVSILDFVLPQPPGRRLVWTRKRRRPEARRTRRSCLSVATTRRTRRPLSVGVVSRLRPGGLRTSTTARRRGFETGLRPSSTTGPLGPESRAATAAHQRAVPGVAACRAVTDRRPARQCQLVGGFEAQAWRPSQLNHRAGAGVS